MSDASRIAELINQGSSASGLKAARLKAKAAWAAYPTNGCAYYLSALLQNAGINVPTIGSAGNLAKKIKARGWQRIALGQQKPGDIGVTFDNDPTPPGADHIYLVIETHGADRNEMVIADNQGKVDVTKIRYASGKGKTPTEYFLRAV